MACHCRRVEHPLVGTSIGCISVMIPTFMADLEASIPRRARFYDAELTAVFIDPRWEEVLCRVAARHFGEGVRWDDDALPGLLGWDPRWEKKGRPYRRRTGATRGGARRVVAKGPLDLAAALAALGLAPGVTLAEARKVYRRGCLTRHPDRGGSTEAMTRWNAAWEVAKEALA